MKRPTWLAMFGVVAAFAVIGVVSANSFSSPLAIGAVHETQAANPFGMIGHITMTVYDKAGNILEYRQTDNTIVNVGENCVAEAMFNVTSTGGFTCDGTGVNNGFGFAQGGFTRIQVGQGGDGTDDSVETETSLITAYDSANTMSIQNGTSSLVSSTGTGSSAVATVSADFTAVADDTDVNESGIFDRFGSTDRNMLARQGFPNVTLSTGDTLTVEWEITVGGP